MEPEASHLPCNGDKTENVRSDKTENVRSDKTENVCSDNICSNDLHYDCKENDCLKNGDQVLSLNDDLPNVGSPLDGTNDGDDESEEILMADVHRNEGQGLATQRSQGDLNDGNCKKPDDVKDSVVNKENVNDEKEDFGIPVDRGWAWMVVLGCFGMHIVVIGGCKSFGILYVEFKDRYQPSDGTLTAVISLPMALMFGLGIFGNTLAAHFSSRSVVFIGSIISCVGFFLTALMPEFIGIVFTFGILTGVGFCMCYGPGVIMVAHHFRKYRSLANGISIAGSGVGSFAIPNLMRYLIREYGLPGCLFIFSGIILNVAVFAMFFRPFSYRKKKTRQDAGNYDKVNQTGIILYSNSEKDSECVSLMQKEKVTSDSGDKQIVFECGGNGVGVPTHRAEGGGNGVCVPTYRVEGGGNGVCVPTYRVDGGGNGVCVPTYRVDGGGNGVCVPTYRVEGGGNGVSVPMLPVVDDYIPSQSKCSVINDGKDHLIQRILNQSALTPAHSYGDIHSLSMQALNDVEQIELRERNGKRLGEENVSNKKGQQKSCLSVMKSRFDLSLVINPVFLLCAVPCLLATPGYANVFMILPDHAESNGQDRDSSALLISIIGISDLVGRLFFGWFSDLNLFPKRWGFMGCMAMTGLLNLVLPSLQAFWALILFAVAFGIFGGSYITLIAVLLAEDLGLERMSSSFGLNALFIAFAVFAGPPICGSLKDMTGSWDAAFYFMGILTLTGAVLPFFHPYATRWVKAKEEKKKSSLAE